MTPTTIDQLRKDIDSTRTALIRIESQQETVQEELAKLQEEATTLELDPEDLEGAAINILDDVKTAVDGVREEIQVLTKETGTDEPR